MTNRINNDEEHRIALCEINRLWDALPRTDEYDRLDMLVTLVEEYESVRWPHAL